jgi:formylglycine-generating enzyme required for sulfatase activity
VALVGKLAIALQEAHSRGIVHRDLKPRNVMIRTAGSKREPVIVDFGLARLQGPEDVRMTRTGQVMGTPAYMAPEQLRGKPDEIGPACDIYALGVILHELLTGRLPFDGPYPVLVAQILTQPPPPPSAHRPGLDKALDAICLKAMAKEVSGRYASMMELATALTEYLRVTPSASISGRTAAPISRPVEGDSIPTGADTLVSRLLNQDGTGSPSPTEGAGPSPRTLMGRRPPLRTIIMASVVLGLCLVTGIIFAINNREDRSRTDDALTGANIGEGRPSTGNALITNLIGMKLRLIPAGTFQMGSDTSDPDAQDDEKVAGKKHAVRITRPFYMGTTEVTVGQFRKFVEKMNYKTEAEKDGKGDSEWNEAKHGYERHPKSTWRSPGFKQEDDHPVVDVSWNDAMAFCEWLSQEEGQSYRLPTEAEWEYACRARRTTRYSSGDDPESLATVANVADGTARERYPDWTFAIKAKDVFIFTAPVGRFLPNAFGLFDMHGNVWEWCADYSASDYYAKSPPADPQNQSRTPFRVLRGGSWFSEPRYCRSAGRAWYMPGARNGILGFRVVRVRSGQ